MRKREKKMSFEKAVGLRLNNIRTVLGFETQSDFADELGVLPNRYNNWESGLTTIPVKYALIIRRMCGATLDYIYVGDFSCVPRQLASELEAVDKEQSSKSEDS